MLPIIIEGYAEGSGCPHWCITGVNTESPVKGEVDSADDKEPRHTGIMSIRCFFIDSVPFLDVLTYKNISHYL